ncbi:hypothetical protein phytr_7140 [Candidatus Phycorickettsia trachydisci]|uniref:Uncharacterized protein n=1 Tax=Candidatus Phycorickettsia trachydisci TaxID=2115978 RepID=A0A2P1P8R3_9RICK|nr:hypothetical protein [Candidatus Phycorickettsia trachydisci]AVP87654.1 hypothetical protein phytr_7140 [Candidatus Phycorickettsia trachydisci]
MYVILLKAQSLVAVFSIKSSCFGSLAHCLPQSWKGASSELHIALAALNSIDISTI